MNKFKFSIILTFIFFLFVPLLSASDYWQQWVHYQMDVSLDTSEHTIKGISKITYVNHSPDTLDKIYMHLYPNAFQVGSVKYREFQRVHYDGGISADNPSYIKILRFEINSKGVLQPVDIKIIDTILEAPLPNPLHPGDTLQFELDWLHQVREHNGRAGYKKSQYDMAQWYPKMVVYDHKGWQNIPFHAMGEFYGEFGIYDVTLDLPGNYIVGATGVITAGDPGWSSVTVDTSIKLSDWLESREEKADDFTDRRSVTFHAEQVHDFAWIASPNFLYESGEWEGITIHVLYDAQRGQDWTKEVVRRGERVLEWLSTNFGEYPYPQVTITHALLGGGMEYPMLVMNGSSSEGLIAHEVGHIWFYGILGNNELEEAWLDEGFTTFQTGWYMMKQYPPFGREKSKRDHFGKFRFLQNLFSMNTILESTRWDVADFITSGYNTPIAGPARKSLGFSVYRQNAYSKPANMLYNLKGYLGEERFLKAMQAYYDQWKLKHPNEERFRFVMEKVTGEELDWFFNSWLHEKGFADYTLSGWDRKQLSNGEYEVTATIINKGTMEYPLDVEVELANGKKYRPERWTNFINNWKDNYTFTVPSKPKRITLDPDDWILDIDRRDNSSGLLRHKLSLQLNPAFNSPRDAYKVTIFPSLIWYHPLDGWKPGLMLNRAYGFWTHQTLNLSYGIKSQRIFWSFGSSHDLRNILPGVNLSWGISELEGVKSREIQIDHFWSKWYHYPPTFSFSGGYQVTTADGSNYTDLYEAGTVGLLFGNVGLSVKVGYFNSEINIAISSSGGSISDWDFSRLIISGKFSTSKDKVHLAFRFMGGGTAVGSEGLPIQEKFTIQSAGAADYYHWSHLRHRDILSGLRDHFHIYGDANLRGYYAHGYEGAESVIVSTLEAGYQLFSSLKVRSFFDGGWLWSVADNFEGDLLMDAGVGFSFKPDFNFYGYSISLRIDFPFWISEETADQSEVDFNRWLISFQKGL